MQGPCTLTGRDFSETSAKMQTLHFTLSNGASFLWKSRPEPSSLFGSQSKTPSFIKKAKAKRTRERLLSSKATPRSTASVAKRRGAYSMESFGMHGLAQTLAQLQP